MEEQKQAKMMNQSSAMADLPSHILIEIISRLPIKTVMAIKCVCKSLLSVVSDSHFKVLYSTRAPTELYYSDSATRKSMTTFCIAEYVFVDDSLTAVDAKSNVVFELPYFSVTSTNYCNLGAASASVRFVNSCRGLVCYSGLQSGNMFAVICNPFTREYITFPCPTRTDKTVDKGTHICYGLGFSPRDNKFKLLRRSYRNHDEVLEIYTFGERGSLWKRVANNPNTYPSQMQEPVFNEGTLHWCRSYSNAIVTFDFDTELFGKLVTPPGSQVGSIGVFENCLYTTDNVGDFGCMWVLKEYGQDSWVKIFSIQKDVNGLWGNYKPFKYLRNGQVLMFKNHSDIVCFNPDTGSIKNVSGICHRHGKVSIRPSLVSLKVLLGDNVKVHSVKPWDRNKVATIPRVWASSVVVKDIVKANNDPQGSSTPSSSEALVSTFHPTKEKVKENVLHALQQGNAEVGNSGSKDLMLFKDTRVDHSSSGTQKLTDEIEILKVENERKGKAIDTLNAENELKGKTIDTLNVENEQKGKAIETLHLEIDRQGKKIAKLKQRKKMDRALVRIMLQQMLNATPNTHEDDSSSSDDSD